MSEGKEIKFKFIIDEQSAQRVNKVLDDMIKRAQTLAQTLQGISMPGGGPTGAGGLGMGRGAVGASGSPQSSLTSRGTGTQTKISAIAIDNGQAFKNMASMSKDAMQVMSDAIKRGIGEQQRELKTLDQTIANLAKRYGDLQAAQQRAISQGMKPGAAANLYGGELERIQGQMIAAQGQRPGVAAQGARLTRLQLEQQAASRGYGSVAEMQAHQLEMDKEDAGIGPSAAEKYGIGFKGRMAQLRGGLSRLYSGAGGGGLIQGIAPRGLAGMAGVAAGALGAVNFGLDETLAGDRAYAGAEARRGSLVESKIRGMHGGDTRWLFNLMQLQQDSTARQELGAQTGGTAAGLEQVRSGVGQFVGSVPIIGGIGRALGLVGPDQGGGALGGFTTASQQSGMAENAFKMMDEKSKSTAMLYANMAQESFQRRMGTSIQMQRVMGVGGLQYDPKKQMYTSAANDLMTKLEGQGYDAGQYMGAYQGLRGQAGTAFAGRNAWLSMAAGAQGYGGFDQLLGASARLGQGKTLAMGAIGGGIEKAAGIQLGAGILGQGFDVRGTTTGYGSLAAAQAGMGFTGNSSDFNKVQRALAGLESGSALTTGGLDAYQQGRNLVGAIGINAGGSTYSQDFLATGMSMKQMLDMSTGGRLTESAKALGLDSGKIKQQLGESMGSVFDRFVDEGKNDPMSQAIRRYQASGMSNMTDYLKDLRKRGDVNGDIKTLGAAASILTGEPEEGMVGAFQILSGQGAKLKSGKIGGGIGGVEKTALESQQKLQEQVDVTLKIIGESLQATYKAMPEATKKLANFGNNLSQEADQMMTALGELTKSFQAATAAFNAASGRKPTAPPAATTAQPKSPGKK